MPKFVIGRFEFNSKAAATERVRAILNREGLDVNDNRELIKELLLMHPRSDEISKYADSIDIRVDASYSGRSRQFFITLHDGSTDAISYKHCIDGKYNKRQRIINIMRIAIQEQIEIYREDNFKQYDYCPICRNWMSYCHVDHVIKFRDLVSKFMEYKGLTFDSIEFDVKTRQFGDAMLIREWREFHAKNAVLRCICADCNIKIA